MLRTNPGDEKIELGIRDQFAHPGDHIAYFWETDKEFLDAIRFLEVGIRQGDSCVIFGHDEANARVLEQLICLKVDCNRLKGEGRLAVITGSASGEAMLAEIAESFSRALEGGSRVLRLLGNIGWGRPSWPNDAEILAFEARVTKAVRSLPAVVVCMYDVGSLSGDVLLRGAFETHALTIRRNVLRENQHYVPIDEFLATLNDER